MAEQALRKNGFKVEITILIYNKEWQTTGYNTKEEIAMRKWHNKTKNSK